MICTHGPDAPRNEKGRCRACHAAAQQKRRKDAYNERQRLLKEEARRTGTPPVVRANYRPIKISTGYETRESLMQDLSELWHRKTRQSESDAREILTWERQNPDLAGAK